MHFLNSFKYLRISVGFFISLILINSDLAQSSNKNLFVNRKNKIESDFENVFFKYSTSFEDYDSYSKQFDNFFGLNNALTNKKRNFQDLSVSIDSKEIRDLYKKMLKEISDPKKIMIEKEPFYKNKI
tara:strand:+ start:1173 stop:1553 length:381 start_codon:yes stop_codon:yes gene_type:complete